MSNNGGARQRHKAELNAPRSGGFEGNRRVGATSRSDLWPATGEGGATWMWQRVRFAGRNQTPPLIHIAYAMVMEMIGAFILGSAVALGSWSASSPGSNEAFSSFKLAVVYALAYYVGTRWVKDHILRRHLSGAITAGYFVSGDVGLLGVFSYTVAQYIGGLIAGGFVAGCLKGVGAVLPRSPVPIPVVTGAASSLATVVCLELFCAAIYTLTLLLNEFLNTRKERAVKNFNTASLYTAVTIAILVMLTYQFQVFTFNNVAYAGGLFGGINAASVERDIANVAQLTDAVYGDTVFLPANGGNGSAWALYLFMPYVGGLLGGALFWALFFLRADEEGGKIRIPGAAREVSVTNEGEVIVKTDTLNNSIERGSRQTQLSDLVSPLKQ